MISHEAADIMARRMRTMRLTDWGWTAREIAYDLGVDQRTVQRYQRAERRGIPTGWPPR